MRWLLLVNFLIQPVFLKSQNLVPNSGFEEYVKCPADYTKQGQIFSIPGWRSANTGTPDYFNECSKYHSKASTNWAGKSDDNSGSGYGGIISFMSSRAYREYIKAELIEPLDSGVVYYLQFSYRLASNSGFASGKLGMALTDIEVNARHDKRVFLDPVVVAIPDEASLLEIDRWQTASADYTAVGGERYLLIGNFFAHDETPFRKIKRGGQPDPMLKDVSYFYLDDVVVQKQIIEEPAELTYDEDDIFSKDSVVILKNVNFAFNSAVLNPNSITELNRLLKYLKNYPYSHIEILGHTDDQGSDSYNMDLSMRRARSVVNYLVENGIENERLRAFGFGKRHPLIASKDEVARSINRRVEVRLVND